MLLAGEESQFRYFVHHLPFTLQKESLQLFGGWMESTAPKLRLDGPRARERTCVFNGGQFANEIEVAGFNKGVFQDFLVRIVIK